MRALRTAVAAAAVASGIIATPLAFGQAKYPSKTVTMVVPYGPGTTDIFTRVMANALQNKLGGTFVVENRTGALGNVGYGYVARQPGDGYTLVYGGSTLTINPHVYKLDWDTFRDFTPVARLAEFYLVLTVNKDLPVHGVKEFFDYAKKQNPPMQFGFGGLTAKVALASLTQATGVTFEGVPYKGAADLMTATMAGQIPGYMALVSDVLGQKDAHTVNPLAVTAAKRVPQLPNVPPVSDAFPGYEQKFWFGFMASGQTPRPIVDTLSRAMFAAANEQPLKGKLESDLGLVVLPTGDPDTFAKYLHDEYAKYAEVIKTYRITAE